MTFLYADGGDGWIAEDHPVEPTPITASALDAEAARFAAAGGTAVILRFGSFYGPDSSHTVDALRRAGRGFGAIPGPRDGYVSSISTDDAAAAVELAATEAPGGTYNVVDDEPLTRATFDDVLAAAVGRPRLRPVPAMAVGLLGDKLAHVVRSHRISNRALRTATGWELRHPSVREGVPAVVAGLAQPDQRYTLVSRSTKPSRR